MPSMFDYLFLSWIRPPLQGAWWFIFLGRQASAQVEACVVIFRLTVGRREHCW